MRWPGLVLAGLVLFGLMTAGSGVAQVEGKVLTGASAGAESGPEGTDYYASVHSSSVYVDPVLVEAFELHVNQVAILVLDAEREAQVLAALDRLVIPKQPYPELDMVSILLPRDKLSDVKEIPGVLVIFRNEHMKPYLSQGADFIGAPVVWNTYKVTGDGVSTMIVDSGVDGTHPDTKLGENLVQNVRTTPASDVPQLRNLEGVMATDFDGHGTHVASIAGGIAKSTSAAGKYRGIAWGGKLVGFAAGIQDPQTGEVSFESTTVLQAFEYAISKQATYNIGVVSNSWGANGDFEPNSPINLASLNMYKKGLVVVFAAGNEGADGEHTLNKYSVAPWVLSVAAGDYLNKITKFSSRGTDPAASGLAYDHPDITAPGSGITAAKASGGTVSGGGLNAGEYTTKSGTSMATPFVSGAATLLLSKNPKLSPDNVMDILTATSSPLLGFETWEAGAGHLNVLKAYQLASKTPGDREAFLSGKVKYAGRESGDSKFERDAVSVGYGAGAAVQLQSGAQNIEEFASELIETPHGLVFLVGSAALFLGAFGLGRRRF